MSHSTWIFIREHFQRKLMVPEVEIRDVNVRPNQQFTDAQLEALPETFRCYSCMQIKPRAAIGGIERGQRLCNLCYPYLSDWGVGRLIAFDIKHGFPPEGYTAGHNPSKKPKARPVTPEDAEKALTKSANLVRDYIKKMVRKAILGEE